ncbi:C40 family peptidase [Corynebacterium sp.]|uniref:C40 family peptidase n=1 Tax=Corynebacterium sp. TaxID=1720 RepID=UPI0037369726
MIDVTGPVQAIASRIPQQFTPPLISKVPQFNAVAQLAELTDGDPANFYRRLDELADDGATIESTTAHALVLTGLCATDLWNIAQEFIREATLKVPLIPTSPAVAIQLTLFGVECVTRAAVRVERWEKELEPLAERLEERAAVPVEEHTNNYVSPETTTAAAPAPPAEPAPATGDNAAGQAAVAAAKSQIGTPYVWGGSQPGGFDCSGLTSWAYAQAGVEIPRTAENQAVGQQVAYEDLQEGDLVVWDGHVAMYAGDGMMVEAGDPVGMSPVRTNNLGMAFKGFWRPTA